MMFEHKYPLNLIDLWLEQLQHEEEDEEDEEENEEELIAKQGFQCLCVRCDEEINWFHRYYYTCCQCGYLTHKFCADLPERLEDLYHVHTLYSFKRLKHPWWCEFCLDCQMPNTPGYRCSRCKFSVDVKCATKRLQTNVIYHPSHKHPLVCMTKQILCGCDACGKVHKGIFYYCPVCSGPFIHNHCAFLPQKLQIQQHTNNFFSHIHPLTLAYSFPIKDQHSKNNPSCRVCRKGFLNDNIWIYKCEKCRYYTHLKCATSRNEPFMSILTSPGTGKKIKNYEDVEHPNLLHLPFSDPSYSILKHLFSKKNESSTTEFNVVTKTHIIHQHPLIPEDARCTDIISPAYSRIKSISFHDPMKRIELLCDGCLRPITTTPIYMCANEDDHCNFVLHKWCSQLPSKLKDHPHHPQHTLVFHSKIPGKFFGVFYCDICNFPCNGFAYYCEECIYYIDVKCAFLPKKITHTSHPNHLLSIVQENKYNICSMCGSVIMWKDFAFTCDICDYFYLHPTCALLLPETTMHKCDKHPMKLSYFPIENHKSEYFCEICEDELSPESAFYHCQKCMQSIHTSCAPIIARYETELTSCFNESIFYFVNVKFGGTYKNFEMHSHLLSFVQGIEYDGRCTKCQRSLKGEMIFKCINCNFAIDYNCCEDLSK